MAELISETPEVRASLRDTMSKEGVLASVQMDPTKQERTKFEQYYEHSEPISKAPSHRYLAMRRGEREGVLRLELQVEDSRMLGIAEDKAQIRGSGPWELLHKESARESWRRLLQPSLETDVRTEAKLNADREAVEIFAENLKNLILAALSALSRLSELTLVYALAVSVQRLTRQALSRHRYTFLIAWCDREGSSESDLY